MLKSIHVLIAVGKVILQMPVFTEKTDICIIKTQPRYPTPIDFFAMFLYYIYRPILSKIFSQWINQQAVTLTSRP
ncbi:MAG: hypothetical protein A2W36_07050 [Chloroflexi bacterium RBG_16_58_14]|nr:MAG: hypothetical protein A2W36_07050 [Chloroflexi bacterium RBG_16_58_14]